MDETCPFCRHVIPRTAAGTLPTRCGNCGSTLPWPVSPPVGAIGVPAASVPAISRPVLDEPPRSDGTGVASLVLSLVFCVPVLPQVLAIVLGLVSLLRRPVYPQRSRSTAAVFGLILGCLFLIIWVSVVIKVMQMARTVATMPMAPMPYGTWAMPADDDDADVSRTAQNALEHLNVALRRYRSDFRRWPARPEDLTSIYLPESAAECLVPRDGKSPRRVLLITDVDPDQDAADRIVAYSVPVHQDLNNVRLAQPHRWVLRLSGIIELLPAETVDAMVPAAEAPAPSGVAE